jgi:hypothetical protein
LNVTGQDSITTELSQPSFLVKCLLSESAAAFFPARIQHSEFRAGGLRYEDDSRGNALAGTITPRRFAIRLHAKFSPSLVARLARDLLDHPDLAWASGVPVFYGEHEL